MRDDKENIIVSKTEDFALAIIEFSEKIYEMKRYRMADQIFGSGTSIGANIAEAQNAESKNDFIHKLKIAAKEADETAYWLKLCNRSQFYPSSPELYLKLQDIQRILSKIISSSKAKP